MSQCTSCGKYFDQDDFMSDEYEGSTLCPDCYFGGGAIEEDEELDCDLESELDFTDDEDCEDEDTKIFKEFFGDDLDQDDECDDFDEDEFRDEFDEFEDRLDAEEGDYE